MNELQTTPASMEPIAPTVQIDVMTGPTPEQTDQIIARYESAVRLRIAADQTEAEAKKSLINLVTHWGHAAAGSEHSRVINGALNTAMVTDVTTTSLIEERIVLLRDLLKEKGHEELFSRLFSPRIKHQLVAGADDALRTMNLPKWLTANVKQLFAGCIRVTNQASRVKVDLRVKEPKQRKPRAKKAVTA